MKKQFKTYGLAIAVIVIWGYFGIRIWGLFSSKDDFLVNQDLIPTSIENIGKDQSFTLSRNYLDPFLKDVTGIKNQTVTNSGNPAQINTIPDELTNPEVPWPNIQYLGWVKGDNNSSSKYLLFRVNGKLLKKRKGEYLIPTIRIQTASDQGAILRKGMETRTFNKGS